MKESTGETNMTIVTILVIAAVAAVAIRLFPSFVNSIKAKWDETANKGDIVDTSNR